MHIEKASWLCRTSPSTGINRTRWRFLTLSLNHWHSALCAKLSQSANALILVSYSYCLELSSKKSIRAPLTCNWNYLFQISTKISPPFEYAFSRKCFLQTTTVLSLLRTSEMPELIFLWLLHVFFKAGYRSPIPHTLLTTWHWLSCQGEAGFSISFPWIPVSCDYSRIDTICLLRLDHKT